MSYSNIVTNALKYILENDDLDISIIEKFFSKDYFQVVNGNKISFSDFVSHVTLLKKSLTNLKVTILSVAENGEDVHTHHMIKANKKDGYMIEFEIFSHFSVSKNKIKCCYELTRKIIGNEDDDDLGFRS
ncbi:nuclear transport factor 2 family protein [Xenorhabdus griffiniae]|uniref:Nuclear transport factor 2 family protein n=1 Tax=Xenorhabdus griffiniae TaxID=351672 RepID=A0ABY9XIX0_9GAMM|nr:nuclear transport factor 2 family protein [Xenorhabdus griffiniae]MBD1227184.1 nuclear transport factor 2 family protein [Xenorhabdus griffiniae]MBE8588040.1 nuclear transport factor 2 family protein [Xenorhabdus griffiniae]WMV72875.1 nuclear transport factor 2 family protein [Xenorhabdus griffiniae]WNH02554.1 nuclear transport factor 2 family protein [Xenorhabdus griffiniae]